MKVSEHQTPADAARRACKIVGGQSALARALNISKQFVGQWCNGTAPIPAHHCVQIEKLSNGAVRSEEMCPVVEWPYIRGTAKQ